jgi:type II secretory pathway pseudopilin PulG
MYFLAANKYGQGRAIFGMVLMELLLVVAMVSLLTAVAALNYTGVFSRSRFESRAYDLIDVIQKAQEASERTDARYAVVFDFVDRSYTLREYKSLDLETLSDEEAIITRKYFDESFQLDYIIFDDYEDTREFDESALDRVIFWAGRSGWRYGGTIVLFDVDGNSYSIVVNRLGGKILLEKGEVLPIEPKRADEMVF